MGVNEGAHLVAGGGRGLGSPDGRGYFVEPTVFADVEDSMTIAKEEVSIYLSVMLYIN